MAGFKRVARTLTDNESALWDHVIADVRPMPGRAPSTPRKLASSPVQKRKPPPKPCCVVPPGGERPACKPAVSGPPPLRHGVAPGLDKRTAQRMKQGKVSIEARIDLHGHTQEEAHRALNAFLDGAHAAGRRCVLVITGKGTRGEGVLRAQVPHWLNAPPNRSRILAFSHAAPKDGGEGALYVLLRRK